VVLLQMMSSVINVGHYQNSHVVKMVPLLLMKKMVKSGVLKTIIGAVLRLLQPLLKTLTLQLLKTPTLQLLKKQKSQLLVIKLNLLLLLLIHITTRTENNLHIQKLRMTVVLGLLLITFAVLNTVIILTPLKVVEIVVVMVLNTVKLWTVLPVDQVTVDMTSTIFQMNSITLVPLTLV